MGFAAHGAELRCFAGKISPTVEKDRERFNCLPRARTWNGSRLVCNRFRLDVLVRNQCGLEKLCFDEFARSFI